MNAAAADAEEIHRLALPQSPRLHFSHELENQTAAQQHLMEILLLPIAAFDAVLGRVFL